MSENNLTKTIKRLVSYTEPYDTYSFLQGVEEGLKEFAIWKDGEQYIGIGTYTIQDLKKAINDWIASEK